MSTSNGYVFISPDFSPNRNRQTTPADLRYSQHARSSSHTPALAFFPSASERKQHSPRGCPKFGPRIPHRTRGRSVGAAGKLEIPALITASRHSFQKSVPPQASVELERGHGPVLHQRPARWRRRQLLAAYIYGSPCQFTARRPPFLIRRTSRAHTPSERLFGLRVSEGLIIL